MPIIPVHERRISAFAARGEAPVLRRVPVGGAADTAGLLGEALDALREVGAAAQDRDDDNFRSSVSAAIAARDTIEFDTAKKENPGKGFAEAYDSRFEAFSREIVEAKRQQFGASSAAVSDVWRAIGTDRESGLRSRTWANAFVFEQNAMRSRTLEDARQNFEDIARGVLVAPDSLPAARAALAQRLDSLKPILDPAAEDRLRTSETRRLSESRVRGLIRAGRLDDAEAELRPDDQGRFALPLTEAQMQTLEAAISSERARLKREAESGLVVERAVVKDLIENDLASRAATGQGVEGLSTERIARAFGKTGDLVADDYRSRAALADAGFRARQEMLTATPTRIAEIVESFRPAAGDRDFRDRQTMFEAAQRQREEILRFREDDPAGYAMTVPEVRRGFADASAAAESADFENPDDNLVGAMRRRVEFQREIGIARPRLLTRRETKAIKQGLETAPTEQLADRVAQLQEGYGPLYREVFRELVREKVDPALAMLAGIEGRPALSNEFATAVRAGRSELVKGLDTAEVSTVEEKVRDGMSGFASAALAGSRTGAAGRLPQIESMNAAVTVLALQRFRLGASAESAARSAVDDIISDRFHVADTWYAPRRIDGTAIDGDRVEGVLDDMKSERLIRAFKPAPFRSIGDTDPGAEARVDAVVRAAARRGFWITNEDGTGVYLAWEQDDGALAVLRDAAGKRYEFDFRAATAMMPDRSADESGPAAP